MRGGGFLERVDATDLGIDLLDGFLADVAGVEDDQIGIVRAGGLAEAGRRQRVRHTMGIVDVHLAAEGLDVDFAGSAHAVSANRCANLTRHGGTCPAHPYI